ncbi:MAG: lmo0937 family membrane protein [Gemmatimonadetes bacterium]|nr:lmo0937 family membrane protein [Gemmatimonadota bacterium]
MIWTIIVILLILWLLGGFVRPVGGFIHLLLVIILILVIIQLVA